MRRRRRKSNSTSSIAWSVSGVALLGSVSGLGYVTATELDYLSRANLPTPPEVTRDVVVSKVTDALGRKASFRILLFTDEFRWRLSSFDALDATPDRPLFTVEMKAVLNSAEGAYAALVEVNRQSRKLMSFWVCEMGSQSTKPPVKIRPRYHSTEARAGYLAMLPLSLIMPHYPAPGREITAAVYRAGGKFGKWTRSSRHAPRAVRARGRDHERRTDRRQTECASCSQRR